MTSSVLINPTEIQLDSRCFSSGLYESYYFRGIAPSGVASSGTVAFWLKHNFLQYKNDPFVSIECTFILFDQAKGTTSIYRQSHAIPRQEYLDLLGAQFKNWDEIHFSFPNSSFFKISSSCLQGQIIEGQNGKDQKKIQWDFNLKLSGETYYHLTQKCLYTGFFPKKKLLTKDIHIEFDGSIKTGNAFSMEVVSPSSFIGMNGHNWGKEHAHKYAYANCNQFQEDPHAYFDGFSAKIFLIKGLLKSPYLSGASLKTNNTWFHFNSLSRSFLHEVIQLSEKKWEVIFKAPPYTLHLLIDGSSALWTELSYHHPDRKISLVRNTKFANANLILKRDSELISSLNSQSFELETLMGE